MGMVVGNFGSGKTKAVVRWAVQNGGLYVRALGEWRRRPLWLLHDIGREIGDHVRDWKHTEKMFREVCGQLLSRPRPIFLDESEYVVSCARLMATVRDLYDLTGAPVVLVGGPEIVAGVERYQAAANRILQRVDFTPLSIEEVSLYAAERAGLELPPDSSAELHALTEGNFRLLDVALDDLERRRAQNPGMSLEPKVIRKVKPAVSRAVKDLARMAA